MYMYACLVHAHVGIPVIAMQSVYEVTWILTKTICVVYYTGILHVLN